jgi:hypothetical protein
VDSKGAAVLNSVSYGCDAPYDVNNANECKDVRRGEYISGFLVRAGFWIDGIQILTSMGRRSTMFGNAHGGDA